MIAPTATPTMPWTTAPTPEDQLYALLGLDPSVIRLGLGGWGTAGARPGSFGTPPMAAHALNGPSGFGNADAADRAMQAYGRGQADLSFGNVAQALGLGLGVAGPLGALATAARLGMNSSPFGGYIGPTPAGRAILAAGGTLAQAQAADRAAAAREALSRAMAATGYDRTAGMMGAGLGAGGSVTGNAIGHPGGNGNGGGSLGQHGYGGHAARAGF